MGVLVVDKSQDLGVGKCWRSPPKKKWIRHYLAGREGLVGSAEDRVDIVDLTNIVFLESAGYTGPRGPLRIPSAPALDPVSSFHGAAKVALMAMNVNKSETCLLAHVTCRWWFCCGGGCVMRGLMFILAMTWNCVSSLAVL